MIVSNQQQPIFCDCRRVYGHSDRQGPCLPTCATYDLLHWHVFAPWVDRKFENWVTVQASTARAAIHAARTGFEPAHSIRAVGTSRDRMRAVERFHYDVDEQHVIVEAA